MWPVNALLQLQLFNMIYIVHLLTIIINCNYIFALLKSFFFKVFDQSTLFSRQKRESRPSAVAFDKSPTFSITKQTKLTEMTWVDIL